MSDVIDCVVALYSTHPSSETLDALAEHPAPAKKRRSRSAQTSPG